MRNYSMEQKNRIHFIQQILKASGAKGIVYGNSGGKDSALVGILCKAACENTVGVIMPCSSKRNFEQDKEDGLAVAKQFEIETRIVDLTAVKEAELKQLSQITSLNAMAETNIAPRLRMTTLYAVAAAENLLVAGTGNASEAYMGYFTKWGDGACDFNPIADLTVTEIYEFLEYLHAPDVILQKAPSAGLYDGQTDEKEMGITYAEIDEYLLNGTATEHNRSILQKYHKKSQHKRQPILKYQDSISSSHPSYSQKGAVSL
ncbi:MAG: NAD(+) synthase [Massiliimalia sp.]|jgi:NAD+ synthase